MLGQVGNSYEIRVRGRISTTLMAHFDGLASRVEPVETVIFGKVEDQAALYGLLDQIESLGLELVEVRRVGARAEPEVPNSEG